MFEDNTFFSNLFLEITLQFLSEAKYSISSFFIIRPSLTYTLYVGKVNGLQIKNV